MSRATPALIEARINVLADQIAAEGMILRAADVRAGAVEISRQRHEIERLRKVITRAKDALLDGQSTQWVHDLLVAELRKP